MRWPEYRNSIEYEKIALDMLCRDYYFLEDGPALPGHPRRHLMVDNKPVIKEMFLNIEDTESPDIQSEELDLGIEVTVAIDEKIAKDIDTFSKAKAQVADVKEIGDYIQNSFPKKKFKRDIRLVSDFGVLVNFDTTSIYDILKVSIDKKIEKSYKHKEAGLTKGYKRFADNWLFVFCPAHVEESEVLDCLRHVGDLRRFNMYIICSLDKGSELWYIHNPYNEIEKRVHY